MLDLTSARCNWNGNKEKTIKSKPTNACCTFLETEARGCDFCNYLRCNCTFKCLGNHRLFVLYGLFRGCFYVPEEDIESGVSKLNDLSNKDILNVCNIWKFWQKLTFFPLDSNSSLCTATPEMYRLFFQVALVFRRSFVGVVVPLCSGDETGATSSQQI